MLQSQSPPPPPTFLLMTTALVDRLKSVESLLTPFQVPVDTICSMTVACGTLSGVSIFPSLATRILEIFNEKTPYVPVFFSLSGSERRVAWQGGKVSIKVYGNLGKPCAQSGWPNKLALQVADVCTSVPGTSCGSVVHVRIRQVVRRGERIFDCR